MVFATKDELARATAAAVSGLDTFYIDYNQTFGYASVEKNEADFFFNYMESDGFARTGSGEQLMMMLIL